jgi:hypothetical protein
VLLDEIDLKASLDISQRATQRAVLREYPLAEVPEMIHVVDLRDCGVHVVAPGVLEFHRFDPLARCCTGVVRLDGVLVAAPRICFRQMTGDVDGMSAARCPSGCS